MSNLLSVMEGLETGDVHILLDILHKPLITTQ